jgi:chromosome segregation protein
MNRDGQLSSRLDELNQSYPSEKHSILSVVEADNGYQPLAQLLLGSILLAEDVNQAKRLLELGGSAAVTKEGELITANRFLRSGSKSNQAGARLGLKDKIEKLEAKASNNVNELSLKEKALEKLEVQLEELDLNQMRKEYNEFEKEVRKWEHKTNQIQSGIDIYEKNVADLKNRRKSLTSSEDSAKDELKNLNPKQNELREKIENLTAEQNEKKEALQNLEDERAIAQNRYNDAQLKHQDLKNKADNLERDIKTC